MKSRISVMVFLLFAQGLLADETITGRVTRVTSGDTFMLLNIVQRDYTEREDDTAWGFGVDVDLNPPPDKIPTIIHLAEIDAPEMNQPYGAESRKALATKLRGRIVRVTYTEKDRNNHIVGEVYLGDRWINHEVLAEGGAWHAKRYSDDDLLDTAEQLARSRRAGLWGGDKPVAPWDWRQRHPAVTPEDGSE